MRIGVRRSRLPVVVAVFVGWSVALGIVLYGLTPALWPRSEYWGLEFSSGGELTVVRWLSGSDTVETYDRAMQFVGSRPARCGTAGQLDLARMRPADAGRWRGWRWGASQSYASFPSGTVFPESLEVPGSSVHWLWLPEEECFGAYDANTRRRVGYLGADGFSPHQRARPFGGWRPPYLSSGLFLWDSTYVLVPTPRAVYLAHLSERTVREIVEKDTPEVRYAAIAESPVISAPSGGPGEDTVIYVWTTTSLECYEFAGALIASLPLTDAERQSPCLLAGRTGDGTFVIVGCESWNEIGGATVRWVDASGTTLDRAELPMPPRTGDRLPEARQVARGVLQPLPNLAWGTASWQAWRPYELTLLTAVAALAAGLLSALVIAVHSRLCFVPLWQTGLWCLFALGCGLSVLLTYLTTESRPELERCEACRRRKPFAAATCPRCGAQVRAAVPANAIGASA